MGELFSYVHNLFPFTFYPVKYCEKKPHGTPSLTAWGNEFGLSWDDE